MIEPAVGGDYTTGRQHGGRVAEERPNGRGRRER